MWASAAANMRTYLLLKERAAAFRADPEVQAALAASRVAELAVADARPGRDVSPTCSPTARAFEDFDVEAAAAARVRLRARSTSSRVEHLLGARDDASVAGVDSSTQSCKVVIRDAGTGALVRRAGRRTRTAPRWTREAWWRRADRRVDAGRRAGRRGRDRRSARSSTAWSAWTRPARWSARRCCGTTPGRPRAAADLVGELRRPAAWADAIGSVPVASFTVTKLRWLADARAGRRRAHGRGLPAARLADLAPARVGDRGRVDHRPQRRQRHRLLVAATGAYRPDLLDAGPGPVRAVPGVLGPADSPAYGVSRYGRRGHARPGRR